MEGNWKYFVLDHDAKFRQSLKGLKLYLCHSQSLFNAEIMINENLLDQFLVSMLLQ
ncbi:uncharacterized protein G2W53_022648 [Senna tora]|uniref:Uncharacterized protein n=1 Tax=Senna tora TaxID=362788 RepID=A0A834TUR2_9FABA|nr:uncharacterized protein G2W53_022648 [Senna tora]